MVPDLHTLQPHSYYNVFPSTHLNTPDWDHNSVFNEAEYVEENHTSARGCVLEVDVAKYMDNTHNAIVEKLQYGPLSVVIVRAEVGALFIAVRVELNRIIRANVCCRIVYSFIYSLRSTISVIMLIRFYRSMKQETFFLTTFNFYDAVTLISWKSEHCDYNSCRQPVWCITCTCIQTVMMSQWIRRTKKVMMVKGT